MLNRREFLWTSATLAAATRFTPHVRGDEAPAQKFTACVIGSTGKGDYGHGMDAAVGKRTDIEVLAVADPAEAGRAKSIARCGAKRQYADYREMLEKERPQLVVVAPRQTGERHAMLMAALRAGAHVYCEKPFVTTPAEADEVLALAAERKLRIAVAHQMGIAPSVLGLKRRIEQEGLVGDLLEMNAWGKQDARAGGEDLMVLGVHLFDLMRRFAGGDPHWCTARVLQQGRDITRADARTTKDFVGPVAGDEVVSQFAFDKGVQATFTSRGRLKARSAEWGIELVGSKSAARVSLSTVHPPVYIQHYGKWGAEGRSDPWTRLPNDPSAGLSAAAVGMAAGNTRVVDDWLAAIRENREPLASGANGAWAVEMVMAVYWAALGGARVALPLKERGHPLAV
jgi:predicted dehydrogenase